jgi:hypothetical protein
MIKFDLGYQFATTTTDVRTSINVMMLRCKQLLYSKLWHMPQLTHN